MVVFFQQLFESTAFSDAMSDVMRFISSSPLGVFCFFSLVSFVLYLFFKVVF